MSDTEAEQEDEPVEEIEIETPFLEGAGLQTEEILISEIGLPIVESMVKRVIPSSGGDGGEGELMDEEADKDVGSTGYADVGSVNVPPFEGQSIIESQSSVAYVPVADSVVMMQLREAKEESMLVFESIKQMKSVIEKLRIKEGISAEDTAKLEETQVDILGKIQEFSRLTRKIQILVGLKDVESEDLPFFKCGVVSDYDYTEDKHEFYLDEVAFERTGDGAIERDGAVTDEEGREEGMRVKESKIGGGEGMGVKESKVGEEEGMGVKESKVGDEEGEDEGNVDEESYEELFRYSPQEIFEYKASTLPKVIVCGVEGIFPTIIVCEEIKKESPPCECEPIKGIEIVKEEGDSIHEIAKPEPKTATENIESNILDEELKKIEEDCYCSEALEFLRAMPDIECSEIKLVNIKGVTKSLSDYMESNKFLQEKILMMENEICSLRAEIKVIKKERARFQSSRPPWDC